ncbi:MAG TPA: transposase [Thermoanaerobaculia bacterium]|nr:transposase [Thermoanaerobaculia bacterium]
MRDWPHAPLHRFGDAGVYFITAGTLGKQHFFRAPAALDELQHSLFAAVQKHACRLQAWALFSNHYHLVVSTEAGENVRRMLRALHIDSAINVNRRDGRKGRKVWFQFWDTQLTHEGSWLARLRYTHENAVHHGLVADAHAYRWCSASWFEETAAASFVKTVRDVRIDRVSVFDDFAAAGAAAN